MEKTPEIKQAEKKKLFIKTYGCQMNVYDSGRMADILGPLGYEPVTSAEGADMVILNTCHIREKAEEKVYSDLGRIRDVQKAETIVAVAGCVAQASGEEILQRAPFVDIVLGPQTYHRLPEIVARAVRAKSGKTGGRGIIETDFPAEAKFDFLPEAQKTSGVSAFLAVQEGCDRFCTFCVVPYTRGAEYSRPVHAVVEEARRLVDQGVKEITLLGQNVNAYHGAAPQGAGEWDLARLIEELALRVPDLQRLRYTTSHPRDMTEALIKAHRDVDILMPYLHLPVQSGADRILEKMNRQHKAAHYVTIIDQLRQGRPDLALSSDFIVGFPGETEEDFANTLRLVKHIGYAQAYSFKYSIRPGTPAGMFEDQVPEEVKEERLARLQALLLEQQRSFNEACVGRVLPVLFEKRGRHTGQIIGRSPYLQSVYVTAPERLIGSLEYVKILKGQTNSLAGEIVTTENQVA